MSTFTIYLRASARLLAVLALFGVMLTANQTPAAAQPCVMSSGCTMVPYCNLTMPPMIYQVTFILCCGGVTVLSPPHTVNPSPGPCPPFMATQTYYPPSTCTVLGIASITPFPPFGFTYSPAACILTIN